MLKAPVPQRKELRHGAFLIPYFLDWLLTAFIFQLGGGESVTYPGGIPRPFGAFMVGQNLAGLLLLKFGALGLMVGLYAWCEFFRDYGTRYVWKAAYASLAFYFLTICIWNVRITLELIQ